MKNINGVSSPFLSWSLPLILLLAFSGCTAQNVQTPAKAPNTASLRGGSNALTARDSIVYSGPIEITHGGIYSGNWMSTDLNHPVVFVNTSEPVIIENCNIKSDGPAMISTTDVTTRNWRINTDLIVRNCNGYGIKPSVDGVQYPVFVDSYQAKRLWVENNYMEHTRAAYLNEFHGDGSANQSIRFTHNVGRNIDGRYRDGSHDSSGTMFQLNSVKNTPNIEVAWNQIINEPGQSAVGDNLNFYATSGTASSPILVHDNYIQGAYASDPTAFDFNGTGMTTDGPVCNASMSDAECLAGVTRYMNIYNNQTVSTCNAGINNVVGIDIKVHDNRSVTSGLLPDGRLLTRLWTGIGYGTFYSHIPDHLMVGNDVSHNTVGYVTVYMDGQYRQRQDVEGWCLTNHPEVCHDNISLPNPLTLLTEAHEWQLWNQKLQANQITIGTSNNGSNGVETFGTADNYAWGAANGGGSTPAPSATPAPTAAPVATPTPTAAPVATPAPTATPAPSNARWTVIGHEYDQLTVPANSSVRYGANGNYVTKQISGPFQATNQFFGNDPAYGFRKEVAILKTSTVTHAWVTIGHEYDTLTVGTNAKVRYGAGTSFVSKTITGKFTATNGYFGGDPAVGLRKQVDVYR